MAKQIFPEGYHPPTRRVYRARFAIDVDCYFADDDWEHPMFIPKPKGVELMERNYGGVPEEVARRTDRRLNHVNDNFLLIALDRLLKLFYLEGEIETYEGPADKKAEKRNSMLDFIDGRDKHELRVRLTSKRGPKPIKNKSTYQKDREKFVKDCVSILKRLTKKNKTRLAESKFAGANPLQDLRRACKQYNITFEELIEQSEQ